MLFTIALTTCFIPFVAAHSTVTAPASAPSASASTTGKINVHNLIYVFSNDTPKVDVAAGGQFILSPNDIKAPNGTLVTFYFPSAAFAHSVTQSSFEAPCTYLAATDSSPAGFDSGLTAGTQFTIKITNDGNVSIWFHCKRVMHCGKGMVGSINAPSSGNTLDAFKAAALAIGGNEATETDTGAITGGFNAQATASPAATASSSATTTTLVPSLSRKSSGSKGFL